MSTRWTDAQSASIILDRMRPLLRVSPKGLQWSSYRVNDAPGLLAGLLKLPSHMGEHDKVEVARAALNDAAKRGQLDAKGVLRAAGREVARRARLKNQDYVVLTTLSMKYISGIKRVVHAGSAISFTKHLPKRFSVREAEEELASKIIYGPIPTDYLWVRVAVSGPTVHSAFDAGLDRLDVVRGLWNLALNHSRGRRLSMGRIRPVNYICLGPIHTLHNPDGSTAVSFQWWEPGYVEPLEARDLSFNYDLMSGFEQWARRSLRRHSFGATVASAVLRYVRALDERETTTAFLKLWGVIELLTGTVNADYKTTCRRAAFVFKDRDFHYAVLKTLRDRRNRIVHVGADASGDEHLVYQAKRYAEDLIILALESPREFEGIEDFGSYLDLPTEKSDLDKRIRRLEMARALDRDLPP